MIEGTRNIGVTLGDPSGVGPELLAALIADHGATSIEEAIFFCDRLILERAFTQRTGRRLPDTLNIVDRGLLSPDQAVPGRPTEAGARAQVGYLEAAAKYALRGEISAVVTAPVSKTQCRRAGLEYPGQTEFFAARLKADPVAMLFTSPGINVILATTHVPISSIATTLTAQRLDDVLALGIEAMQRDLSIASPRVGVVGLNPHAGESGLLGSEEIDLIGPAMERARERHGSGVTVEGPLIPDHAFRQQNTERFDLLVSMYHDQALIPLKMVDFDHTVNVTTGLPIIRTSPDHGVAYDIAGSGKARPDSFVTAFDTAGTMSRNRFG